MYRFEEMASVNITETKKVVISRRSDGMISLAQRVPVETETGQINVFLKNALVLDRDAATRVIAALTEAVAAL